MKAAELLPLSVNVEMNTECQNDDQNTVAKQVRKQPLRTSIPSHFVPFWYSKQRALDSIGHAFNRLGDVIRLRGLPWNVIAVRDPELAEQILKDEVVGATKTSKLLPRVASVMKSGSYIKAGGEEWKKQRLMLRPGFSKARLELYANKIPDLVDDFLEFSMASRENISFDVVQSLRIFITRASFRMFFSEELSDSQAEMMTEHTHYIEEHFIDPIPLCVPTPANLRFKRSTKYIRDRFFDLVIKRTEEKEDLFGSLLVQFPNPGDAEKIVDELCSIYFGASVMATSLAWMLFLVAKHQTYQNKMRVEIERTMQGRMPQVSDLENLPLTQWMMQETLRLYPASWGYPRHCRDGMTLGGVSFPKNSIVIPMVYHLQRHPEHWNVPDVFMPERFRNHTPAQGAYMPFGRGQRTCTGSNLAPLVMRLFLARFLQRYRIVQTDPNVRDPQIEFGFEIYPKQRILARLEALN